LSVLARLASPTAGNVAGKTYVVPLPMASGSAILTTYKPDQGTKMPNKETTNNTKTREDLIASKLKYALDKKGYAFHQAAMHYGKELFSSYPQWRFEVYEFSVDTKGKPTRIDFILKHKSDPIYLVIECKRANPALKDWCFARTSYLSNGQSYPYSFNLELVEKSFHGVFAKGKSVEARIPDSYHIGIEVKSNTTGDSEGSSTDEIEKAAGQVCQGMNGLVNEIAKYPSFFEGNSNENAIAIIPIILTTASLWASEIDLGTSNQDTGEIADPLTVVEKDWVYYQYHQTSGIKHSHIQSMSHTLYLWDLLDSLYLRTIPIVRLSKFGEFLKQFPIEMLHVAQRPE
jgi:hypothetical protein